MIPRSLDLGEPKKGDFKQRVKYLLLSLGTNRRELC